MNEEKSVNRYRPSIKDAIYSRLEKLAYGKKIIILAVASLVLVVCGISIVETSPTTQTSGMTVAEYRTVENRARSDNDVAAALGKFEQKNGKEIFKGAMQFFSADAKNIDEHSKIIKLSQSLGLKPLVILEPSDGMSYPKIARGDYNQQIQTYFEGLRSAGISSEELGDLVICPEPVVGGWPNATADNYADCVAIFAGNIRKIYPDAHLSVLLDTSSEELGSLLKQYRQDPQNSALAKLSRMQLSSVGIQAFANTQIIRNSNTDFYFDPQQVRELCDAIGNYRIWLNTGITVQDKNLGVIYGNSQQAAVASSIFNKLQNLKDGGTNVSYVNLFLENKTAKEKRSFAISPDGSAIKVILKKSNVSGVLLYGFDAQKD
jgi:hypothetical protein